MPWKIYTVLFALINIVSFFSFNYLSPDLIGLITLILSAGLNIAVFSYAFKKPVFSKIVLVWLFKLNIGLYILFFALEFLAFLQEIIGAGINLPTAGFVSVIASFPSLPALYANYKMAFEKQPAKKGKKKKAKG